MLKVTMGTFYRPSGRPVQGRGVQPDVPLPGLGETEALFEEAQPFALPADSLAGASFVPRPAPPLAALRERSRERLQTSGFGDGVTALNRALREEAEGPTAYAGFAAFLQKRARQVQTARALLEAEAGASPFRCRRPSFDGTASDESLPLWTAILETDPYLREAYRVIADWRSLTNDN